MRTIQRNSNSEERDSAGRFTKNYGLKNYYGDENDRNNYDEDDYYGGRYNNDRPFGRTANYNDVDNTHQRYSNRFDDDEFEDRYNNSQPNYNQNRDYSSNGYNRRNIDEQNGRYARDYDRSYNTPYQNEYRANRYQDMNYNPHHPNNSKNYTYGGYYSQNSSSHGSSGRNNQREEEGYGYNENQSYRNSNTYGNDGDYYRKMYANQSYNSGISRRRNRDDASRYGFALRNTNEADRQSSRSRRRLERRKKY